jgi:hypothetical protein
VVGAARTQRRSARGVRGRAQGGPAAGEEAPRGELGPPAGSRPMRIWAIPPTADHG